MMEYLNLIWYIIALALVGGGLVWYVKKDNVTVDNKELEQDIKDAYGNMGYRVYKILSWIIFAFALFWMLGQIAKELL